MKNAKISALALALIAFAACHKDPVEQSLVQPAGYLQLVNAYRSEAVFVAAKDNSHSCELNFEGQSILLSKDAIPVYDCTQTDHPPIVLSSNEWLVGGKPSGIPGTKGKTAEQSYPVYVYLYDGTLHMYVSNGEIFHYKKKEPQVEPQKPSVFIVPKVYITHNSDRIHKSYGIPGHIVIEDPDGHYSDQLKLEGDVELQGRGNSTWDMPKKPYKFKFSSKQAVLGMPKAKGWVLLANYADKSLLRNATAMRSSEILQMPWTPRYRIVEVWLNGSYEGVYNLFEKKDTGKNKVDIDTENGDFYLEIEQSIDAPHYFFTKRCNVPIQFKDPEEPLAEDMARIEQLFNDFESTLYGSNFANPVNGYAKYIDVDSFVDNYIIEELAKDIDGNTRKSSFFSLEKKDNLLRFCHQWDFDLSYGNANYFPGGLSGAGGDNNGPRGWWIRDFGPDSLKSTGWYYRLFCDKAFVDKVKARWNEVYPALKTVPEEIDRLKAEMGESPKRNFERWDILGTYVWPNVKVTGSYDKEVDYLKNFYLERLEWLNTNLAKL